MTEEGILQPDGLKVHMVFSKQFNRDVFSQPPIVGTEVNIDIPCFGPERESLVVGKASALSG